MIHPFPARLSRRQVFRFAALGGAALLPLAGARGANPARAEGAARRLEGNNGTARYRIETPDRWNGTLVLYSQGNTNRAAPLAVGDPVTGAALLAAGYALAGSAYGAEGYAVEAALDDQIALLDRFARDIGTPERTIAWGDSQGGLITAGLVQRHPERFAGALPMCGLVEGGVAALNTFLDCQFALQTLLAPGDASLELARFTDVAATVRRDTDLLAAAQRSPAGLARVALAAAFGQGEDTVIGGLLPAPTDYAARARSQATALQLYLLGLWTNTRASAETKAGGNPCFNTGVAYRDLLARSPQRDLVEFLYHDAALDLDDDLAALDAAPRIAADPPALDYLRRNIVLDGDLAVPVLTLHTTGDGAAAVGAETVYADTVRAAGKEAMLRQVYVDRAGHCAFTPAERLAAFAQLVRRIETGAWDEDALSPDPLSAAASAMGPEANVVRQPAPSPVRDPAPVAPAFVRFAPPPFLRPFDVHTPDPPAAARRGAGQ